MKSTTKSRSLPLQLELHLFNWVSSNHLALSLSIAISLSMSHHKIAQNIEKALSLLTLSGKEVERGLGDVSHKLTLTKLHTHFAH